MRIYKKLFGKKLKELRQSAGFSNQGAFAEKVGVETASVSRWETGDSFPDEENFSKICIVLGVKEETFAELKSESNVTQQAMAKTIALQQEEIETLRQSQMGPGLSKEKRDLINEIIRMRDSRARAILGSIHGGGLESDDIRTGTNRNRKR